MGVWGIMLLVRKKLLPGIQVGQGLARGVGMMEGSAPWQVTSPFSPLYKLKSITHIYLLATRSSNGIAGGN